MNPITPFSEDLSADLLSAAVRMREPFFHIRYGDGALECIYGLGRGRTCDGERYSPRLAGELLRAWNQVLDFPKLHGVPRVMVGDWLSASFDGDLSTAYEAQYRELLNFPLRKSSVIAIHFEALLLMRQSEALLNFYRAVKADTRRKLYMGPRENREGAAMLGAEFLEVPYFSLFERLDEVRVALANTQFDVLLWGAGMAGTIAAADAFFHFPLRTYINLGSALDPIFQPRRTRSQQLDPAIARTFMAEFL